MVLYRKSMNGIYTTLVKLPICKSQSITAAVKGSKFITHWNSDHNLQKHYYKHICCNPSLNFMRDDLSFVIYLKYLININIL